MKGVDDDTNYDAKEAGFDEEGKPPQVKRLHVESQRLVQLCDIAVGTSSTKDTNT